MIKKSFYRSTLLVFLLAVISLILPGGAASAYVPPPNNCVGIASDSNGFGHVTFQLPPAGDVGIIYVQPLDVALRAQLDLVGLSDMAVTNRSLSASGLTASDRTNYLKSSPYGSLIADRCKFNLVGPFLPDVAAAKATPEQYTAQLLALVGGLLERNPRTTIFVLNFYQTTRAEFTASNNGFGLTPERIDAFNAQLAQFCIGPKGPLSRIPQVICLDTQSFFADMGTSYLLTSTSRAQFQALVYQPTGFRASVEQFFAQNPDASLIGDGIHLSLAGRNRMMQRIAALISRMSNI